MNIKSNVLKSVFAAGLALTGVAAIGLGTNGQADAATIGDSVTVDYIDGQSIATWSNYYTATVTGSVKDGSSWKVVKTARDASGEKWYKIGKRQWIMAKYTTEASTTSNSTYNANTTSTNTANSTYNANTTSTNTANSTYNANTTSTNTANSTTSSTGTGYTTSYSSSANNYGYGSNYNYTYRANTGAANTSSYSASTTSSSTSASTSTASASTSSSTSTSSSSEEAAKAWIASKESGGSYTASNGNYYGKYQLSLSYLNGDTSAANQEKVANSYVQSRYGSWTAAKAFWQANGWY
ncbi:aggregation-promoting factor [Lactobacillus delbrueckii subsp. bulgaricus]|uniref:aggregation-promoting factor n=1 Tax=Lactobacillus delbrueckii TaxID=1584 RepID=UPI0012E26A21|nr:aggregation promoting factor [Lactobacillus delbrueckii]MBT8803572.1 aggregation promoting factor [Lactobacillus delbrueckii subsp. bulgaricus]MBT8805312.1 aggregation promoting factor [Lactobacillus delbrueckii subsp. bulgaricus]MBT8816630.1 aggregation promoting factor [Lactobacillus delbrueckii subsp. bulgaricus]MBT8819645.1 aggregation promoting factor [Lactobacillus delbrueckii subsp. bulgaricus]MBT8822639.1 aggregation promoting factor [Lactobacillus delbrueckii subsp. bulgaricus]